METVKISTENIDIVNNKSIVGIKWCSGEKSTILKTEANYVGINHNLDVSASWSKPSKREYCRKILSNFKLKHEIFLFKDNRELFYWLSQ